MMGDAIDKLINMLKQFDVSANKNNTISNILDMSKYQVPDYDIPEPEIMQINPEDSTTGLILQQTGIIIEKSQEQIELLQEQSKTLCDTINTLKTLLEMKEKELQESKEEAIKAKKYNTTMLIVALISAGIALASLVATILIAFL